MYISKILINDDIDDDLLRWSYIESMCVFNNDIFLEIALGYVKKM